MVGKGFDMNDVAKLYGPGIGYDRDYYGYEETRKPPTLWDNKKQMYVFDVDELPNYYNQNPQFRAADQSLSKHGVFDPHGQY